MGRRVADDAAAAGRGIMLYLMPTTRDELLEDVVAGRGDIAAGNLTVTEARKQIVDFAAPPNEKPNREIVLGGPKSPPVAMAEALSGQTVHVRWTSSYHDSLAALNQRLAKDGKPALKHKYYTSYKLTMESAQERDKARGQVIKK